MILIVHVDDISYFPCIRHDIGLIVHVDNLSYVPFRGPDLWFCVYIFTISVFYFIYRAGLFVLIVHVYDLSYFD